LSAGANELTLTATDAVGNSFETNITVVQSTVNLIMNAPAGDQLWNPYVTVTGTINDPTDYTVWVNGVKASYTDDNGDWEADDVPTTPGGTAVFQARAIPNSDNGGNGTGGGGTAASYANPGNPSSAQAQDADSQGDKPPRLYVAVYSEGHTSGVHISGAGQNSEGAANWSYNTGDEREESLGWIDQQGGNAESLKNLNQDRDYYGYSSWSSSQHTTQDWPASAWPKLVDGTGTADNQDVDNVTGETNSSSYSFPDYPPPVIALEHCQVAGKNSGTYDFSYPEYDADGHFADRVSYARHAETVMKLETGGKAGSHRQNLFDLSASASRCEGMTLVLNYPSPANPAEYDVPPDWGNWVNVDSTQITIMRRPLGADGNLWVALPDNSPPIDVTPRVPGRDFYTFNVNPPQKYTLLIQVNNSGFLPDKIAPTAVDFCVGQKLTFAPYWLPSTPPFNDAVAHWTLPAKFVNEQPYSYCPAFYDEDPALLDRILSRDGTLSTYCWYVRGLQAATAAVAMNLFFPNGQVVYVKQSGQFNMYRPSVQFPYTPMSPAFAVITNDVFGRHWLMLGYDSGPHFNGNEAGTVRFDALITSEAPFTGEANWLQLKTRSVSPPFAGSDDTGGQTNLDSGFGGFYNEDSTIIAPDPHGDDPTTPHGAIAFYDSPGIVIDNLSGNVSIMNNFKTYLLFKPNVGGIWVPLGVVTWGWSATENSLILGPSSVTQPTYQDTEGFPYYTQ
jgi:hypothetical protein